MNIGITCYPTYGGSGVVATELGKCLAAKGHTVHFITYALPFRLDEFHENIRYHEVDVSTYPLFEFPPYSQALAAKMARVAVEEKLDVLHVHYAIPHATAAYLAKKLIAPHPLKVITTLHGTDITIVGRDPSFLPLVRFMLDESDGVTAVSRYLADRTTREMGTRRPIEVVPNFVDTDHFRRKPDATCPRCLARAGERIILHISNFRPVKRVEDLVRVFARIHQEVPSRLIMIGDGPDREKAATLAAQLGVGDWVRFLGKQRELVDMLSVADLFLLPSEEESFGLAALEAMACGVPVVASTAGGLSEVVRDGKDGALRPVGDVEGMARAALDILGDPARLAAFRVNARTRAEDSFRCRDIVVRYEEYYRKVLTA
jgi:N-acetyl-alpha-D-glucosaminyl L-malate synthase BshA